MKNSVKFLIIFSLLIISFDSARADYKDFKRFSQITMDSVDNLLSDAKNFERATDTDDLPEMKALSFKLFSLNSEFKKMNQDLDSVLSRIDKIFAGKKYQDDSGNLVSSANDTLLNVNKNGFGVPVERKVIPRLDKTRDLNPYSLGAKTNLMLMPEPPKSDVANKEFIASEREKSVAAKMPRKEASVIANPKDIQNMKTRISVTKLKIDTTEEKTNSSFTRGDDKGNDNLRGFSGNDIAK